jgi:hypothetical protein
MPTVWDEKLFSLACAAEGGRFGKAYHSRPTLLELEKAANGANIAQLK